MHQTQHFLSCFPEWASPSRSLASSLWCYRQACPIDRALLPGTPSPLVSEAEAHRESQFHLPLKRRTQLLVV